MPTDPTVTAQTDMVRVSISYTLRGSVIVDIPRSQYDSIEDETDDDAQLLMDELAERGLLDGSGSGITECEMDSISEYKPRKKASADV